MLSNAVLAAVRQPLVILDAGLRIHSANPAFHEQFLPAGEAATGRELGALAGWNVPPLLDRLRGVLSHHEALTGEELTGDFGRGPRTLFINASELNRQDRKSEALMLVAIEDVTERVRIAGALEERERQLRAIFDHALEAIIIFDDQGRFVAANHAAGRLYGVADAEELTGRNLDEFDALGEGRDILEQLRAHGHVKGMHRVTRRDRSHRDVEFAAVADIQPGRHLSIMRDVTEERHLQNQLRQAQKMEAVGKLAGGVAHDFNNLLSAILGFTQLALDRADLLPEGVGRDLEEVHKAGTSAAALTRQLLAFSRQQILEPTVLDVNAILDRLEPMLSRLIGEDIDLSMVRGAGLMAVRADAGQLQQVILNLVVNARDAMPTGGQLTIETANVTLDEAYVANHPGSKAGAHVMLAVTDSGVGMADDVRARIFEPFFTTKPRDRGTGLGLSTVYGIVKQSGGSVFVYSEPGVGTTFKVYLPSTTDALTMAPPQEARDLRGTETILVVEDQSLVVELVRRSLESRGYRVFTALTPAEGLRVSQSHRERLDLLITDVVMPGMSGKQVAEAVRADHPEAKVLYMSGYADEAIVHHGILEPGVAFLQKPFTPSALAARVREVIGEKA